jgi:O-methyltransferase
MAEAIEVEDWQVAYHREQERFGRYRRLYATLSFPIVVLFLLHNKRFHPRYRLTWPRKMRLAYRMWRNNSRIQTGTSYKAHVAMAVKLFELDPAVEGAVVECGCWKGGSTANLSLICDIIDRQLVVYDSFEGLPPPSPDDPFGVPVAGFFRGELEEVQSNVRKYGAIERCTFRKGWFEDTVPHHTEPIVFVFADVDFGKSFHEVVLNLWPHLVDDGYFFIDEYTRLDYCALFFSERYWKKYFNRRPPGLMGAGIGVGVGQYYLGPPQQQWFETPDSVAYTRKNFSGHWKYYPEDPATVDDGIDQASPR